jgi:hypothetical protein
MAATPGLPSFGGHHREMQRWLERHAVDRIVFSHVTRDGLEMAERRRRRPRCVGSVSARVAAG